MADPTDRDRERARELLSDGINAEAFERVAEALAAAREPYADVMRMAAAIAGEFERTVKRAEWEAAGSKGMHVSFHGDFASVTRVPSVISRMRWWARELRTALGAASGQGEGDG